MIRLIKYKNEDYEELKAIMKRAFDEDSKMHLGTTGGPTGYDNGEFIKKWFLHENASPFTIYDGHHKIIGGVNLWIDNNTHINTLGCIFIEPEYENKGVGYTIWQMIEEMYPCTIEWHTETPMFSHRNHHFYINKCGFHLVKIKNPKDINEGSYILVKRMENK